MISKKSHIKHAVIILNYCGHVDTIRCIQSVLATKDAPYIIVVDNHSPDDSVAQIKQAFPAIDLIESPQNLGYAGGNNLGIKYAMSKKAQVVYLLNNDTTVDINIFFRSYRFVADKLRIAGGKIYYTKNYEYHAPQKGQGNILWYAGGIFNWQTVVANHLGVDEVDHGQYDRVVKTEFITGCFMAIPAKVIKKIGSLDESFFLYLEDADYCQRALAAKIELYYNPNLVLYHLNSASTGSGSDLVDYYFTRNRFVLGKRYGSLKLWLLLVKEALTKNISNPIRRLAFFHYLFGKMGNQNDQIFALAKTQK